MTAKDVLKLAKEKGAKIVLRGHEIGRAHV